MSHDVLRDVLAWTVAHGPDWPVDLAQGTRLICNWNRAKNGRYVFDWTATDGEDGGLVNEAVRLLRQEDFKWLELNQQGSEASTSPY